MKNAFDSRILQLLEGAGSLASPDTVYADRGHDVNFRGPNALGFPGSLFPSQVPMNLKMKKVPRRVRLSPKGKQAIRYSRLLSRGSQAKKRNLA